MSKRISEKNVSISRVTTEETVVKKSSATSNGGKAGSTSPSNSPSAPSASSSGTGSTGVNSSSNLGGRGKGSLTSNGGIAKVSDDDLKSDSDVNNQLDDADINDIEDEVDGIEDAQDGAPNEGDVDNAASESDDNPDDKSDNDSEGKDKDENKDDESDSDDTDEKEDSDDNADDDLEEDEDPTFDEGGSAEDGAEAGADDASMGAEEGGAAAGGEGAKGAGALAQTAKAGAVGTAGFAAGSAVNAAAHALQMFMMMMMQMLQTMAIAVLNTVAAITSTIMAIVTTIATVIGVSVMAAAIGVAATVVTIVAVVVIFVTSTISTNTARVDDTKISECSVEVYASTKDINADDPEQWEARAKKVYSVFHELGYSDEKVAGILGNWVIESGITAAKIEGMYGTTEEKYGLKMSDTVKDGYNYKGWQDYTLRLFSDTYSSRTVTASQGRTASYPGHSGGERINSAAYLGNDGIYRPGLGLGQWTGPRAESLLKFANANNLEWTSLDTQLMFMISPEGDFARLENTGFHDEEYDTPGDAAYAFLAKWEGCPGESSADRRREKAEEIFLELRSWSVNTAYANSIIQKANASKSAADAKENAKARSNCVKTGHAFDNSSLVSTAMNLVLNPEYRWAGGIRSAMGLNGTDAYVWAVSNITTVGRNSNAGLFNEMMGYGKIRGGRSCDVGVSTIVKTSGSDDEYPTYLGGHWGGNGGQYGYLAEQSKLPDGQWTLVDSSITDYSKLEPGDVIINRDHVFMYVGNEAMIEHFGEKYPDAIGNANGVESSSGGIPLACMNMDHYLDGTYMAYRLKTPEADSQFAGLMEGKSFDTDQTNSDHDVSMTLRE